MSINVPGSTYTNVSGINNSGEIVGQFIDATGNHGYLNNAGTFTSINALGSVFFTSAMGINDGGQIVGRYLDAMGSHGFLDNAGTLTSITVPGALSTEALGINDHGQIVGLYVDAAGVHGFLATPLPEPSSAILLACGLAGLAGWRFRKKPCKSLSRFGGPDGTSRQRD